MTAAVTVLQAHDRRACNKVATRLPDGSVEVAMAKNTGEFAARTVPCPDITALAAVLREVGKHPDWLISLGIYRNPPSERFMILPMAKLAALIGCHPSDRAALAGWHPVGGERHACARMKENVDHSSFLLFDRDATEGMPEALADLSHDEWLAALDLLFPGIATCGRVDVPSSRTRILVDGVPLASKSSHTYVKVSDPSLIAAKWDQAALRSLITTFEPTPWSDPIGLAFRKPIHGKDGRVSHHVWWTIFDKSVASPERLIFAGAPTVRGAGVTLDA
jgi:hypothetical protein